MKINVADILFSPSVREMQERLGSSEMISKLEQRQQWKAELSEEQSDFLRQRDSFYLGTASRTGRPYIQHRGGSKGFIHVENTSTFWIPDYIGNRQYISVGNLTENSQCFTFFMDYPSRRRLKLWGQAFVHPLDKIAGRFDIQQESQRVEQVIQFNIEAVDENCRKHIRPRFSEAEYQQKLTQSELEISVLKQEIKALKND
jgi:predicted pyridoxine 5'-phosphate oxidase superfamily flavin-nucleotide-binding protein